MSVPRYLRFLREAGSFAQHVVEFNVNIFLIPGQLVISVESSALINSAHSHMTSIISPTIERSAALRFSLPFLLGEHLSLHD